MKERQCLDVVGAEVTNVTSACAVNSTGLGNGAVAGFVITVMDLRVS